MKMWKNQHHLNNKAASLIEYIVLAIIVMGALYIMNARISGGLGARFKTMGDSFGFGRQYDAKRTIACKQDVAIDSKGNPKFDSSLNPIMGYWYDENCYQTRVMQTPVLMDKKKGTFDISKGGCPQCFPLELECFKCEDKIKEDCQSSYCESH